MTLIASSAMAAGNSAPPYSELLWPTLCALKELGNSARLDEINERVIDRESFSEEQIAVLHNDGPRSELEYRLAWARTYLKGMGALASVGAGVWETTELGRKLKAEEVEPRRREYLATLRKKRRERRRSEAGAAEEVEAEPEDSEDGDWKEELLAAMLEMSPSGFEKLAQRLLKAAGFVNPTVTRQSGDGGIDGYGSYRVSLVSFPVFFQCKRYRGAVGPDKVRDFRGAMAGRGDRGLLITTGAFTRGAQEEATRDGAPPVDLIDGERLCDLLEQYQLGVRTTKRTVKDVEVMESFFEELG